MGSILREIGVKAHSSFWRKTLVVAFFPSIIFVWAMGWVLTYIGDS